MSRPVTENDLTVRGFERDCYMNLDAEAARRITAGKVALYRANPEWFDAERWPDDIYANQAQVVADVECCPSLWQRARQWIHDAFGV